MNPVVVKYMCIYAEYCVSTRCL